jgi:hypothetical protein
MITTTHKSDVVESSFESTDFQIETNAYVFDLLTSKVYNDPILASIREISTNAIDACIDAQVPVNFDAHIPTPEESYFSVRDYGTGLSPSDITGLYTTMGASSKRNSNDVNGCMGIGKLAPLSYAKSFTLTSYFNGTAHSYLITTQNGIPTAMHLGDTDTSEPNGVQISFPVDTSDISTFAKRAKYLYRFFQHKPNLNIPLDITLPDSIQTSTEWYFAEDYVPNSWSNYVLMSNILYEIPNNSDLDQFNFRALVLVCPTGSVSINPGRESLSMDKSTIDYLTSRINQTLTEYVETMYDVLDEPGTELDKTIAFSILYSKAPSKVQKQVDMSKFFAAIPALSASVYIDTNYNRFQITSLPDFVSAKRTYSYLNRPRTFPNFSFNLAELNSNIYVADVSYKYIEHIPSSSTVFSRPKGYKLDEFVTLTTEWLDSIDVSYTLVSSFVSKPDKATASPREAGIYTSPLSNSSISKSELADDVEYLYIPVSGSTHILPDTQVQAIICAHYLLNRYTDANLPKLVGISKKYISAVKASDKFTLATDVIQSELDKHIFLDNAEKLVMSTNILRHLDISDMPTDIYQAYLYVTSSKDIPYISKYVSDVSKFYNIKVLKHLAPFATKALDSKYPLLSILSNGYKLENELKHYLTLEASYDPTCIPVRRIDHDYVTYGPDNTYT